MKHKNKKNIIVSIKVDKGEGAGSANVEKIS